MLCNAGACILYSLCKWCLVFQRCFSIPGKLAALFKKPFNFHWTAIFKLSFLNVTNSSDLKLFDRAIQFLIFANYHLNLPFISLSRLFFRSLSGTWLPCQMDDLSLFMPIAVEEYALQNPFKICIGISIAIGVRVRVPPQKKNPMYISLHCILFYIFVHMSCKHQEVTPETLLMICFMGRFPWCHSGTFHIH